MRRYPVLVAVLGVAACAGTELPTPQPASASSVEQPPVHSAPVATATAQGELAAVQPAPASKRSKNFRIKTVVRLGGTVDAGALADVFTEQLSQMDDCVALIRVDDQARKNVNVLVEVTADGVAAELQSRVNAKAHRCLTEGLEKWRADGFKLGTVTFLIELRDRK